MTTPAHLLRHRLWDRDLIDLRRADNTLDSRVTSSEALALAYRGLIEGVGPKSGSIRYLRLLPPQAIEEELPSEEAPPRGSRNPINARTEMGVFREQVEHIDNSVCPPERTIVGYVWAHCAHRHGFRAGG